MWAGSVYSFMLSVRYTLCPVNLELRHTVVNLPVSSVYICITPSSIKFTFTLGWEHSGRLPEESLSKQLTWSAPRRGKETNIYNDKGGPILREG